MFSCNFFEIFENTFFTEHLRVTAFDYQSFGVIVILLVYRITYFKFNIA